MPLHLRDVTHTLIACVFLGAAHASPQPTSPPAATALPAFEVVRKGAAFGVGEDTPFPKKRTPGIVFGESLLYDKSRKDGHFDFARTTDGRRLHVLIYTDDDITKTTTFELKTSGELPQDAVLQMVDGYRQTVAREEIGLGSSTVKLGDGTIVKQLFEAWLALPNRGIIVRPADGRTYPLLPATGPHDPAKAKRAQWVVHVSSCKEASGGPCVYYGPAVKSCARASAAGEEQLLIAFAYPCR